MPPIFSGREYVAAHILGKGKMMNTTMNLDKWPQMNSDGLTANRFQLSDREKGRSGQAEAGGISTGTGGRYETAFE